MRLNPCSMKPVNEPFCYALKSCMCVPRNTSNRNKTMILYGKIDTTVLDIGGKSHKRLPFELRYCTPFRETPHSFIRMRFGGETDGFSGCVAPPNLAPEDPLGRIERRLVQRGRHENDRMNMIRPACETGRGGSRSRERTACTV